MDNAEPKCGASEEGRRVGAGSEEAVGAAEPSATDSPPCEDQGMACPRATSGCRVGAARPRPGECWRRCMIGCMGGV